MVEQPPPGQGPVDPQGAFSPPPPPQGSYVPPPAAQGAPVPPPPPGFMPMMMPPMMPMYAPPPRRSFFRGLFTVLGYLVLGGSLLMNFYLAGGLLGGGNGTVESTMKDGNAEQKVVIIPIHGIVDDGMAEQVGQWVRKIDKDKEVKAIVLHVDTPGGTVAASDQIYHYIKQLKEKRRLPVAVSMGGYATSGGYYVSCGADRIFAQPITWTGNIGVLLPRYNVSALAEKWGVAEKTLSAPANGFKNAGSPFSPENPRDTVYLQTLVDGAYARFKSLVETGRQGKLTARIEDICNGQVFTAAQAAKLGLVDDPEGYLEDACKWAADQAKLDAPMYVKYQRRASLLESLMSKSAVDAPTASRNGGINVNIDPKVVDELMAPRLMYLWRGE